MWYAPLNYVLKLRISAAFNKGSLTFRTANFNLALSSWNTDFLFAGRTFIDMMRLTLLEKFFLVPPEVPNACGRFQKRLILGGSLVNVSGEHSEISINKYYQRQIVQKVPSKKAGKKKHDNSGPHHKSSKRIDSIATIHKTHKFFFHF